MRPLNPTDVIYVVSSLPRDVQQMLIEQPIYLGGGFIRDTIAGTKPSDLDLFSPTLEVAEALAGELTKKRGARKFQTDNAITLLCPPRLPIQFITRWLYDEPAKVAESFDFTVCQAVLWYDAIDTRWCSTAADDFYADLAARRLVYTSPVRDEAPGGSLMRVRKFLARDYRIQAPSLAAVLARIFNSLSSAEKSQGEDKLARAIERHLREVDPLRLLADGSEIVVLHPADAPEQEEPE